MDRPQLPAAQAGLLNDGRPVGRTRIRFRDCDAFGLLYNTRFLDYVLDTRFDHLLAAGIDPTEAARLGRDLPVTAGHQVSYLVPCRVHEDVLISTATIFLDEKTAILEGAITDLSGRMLKFHQWTRFRTLNPKTGAAGMIGHEDLTTYRRTVPTGIEVDPNDYPGRLQAIRTSLRE